MILRRLLAGSACLLLGGVATAGQSAAKASLVSLEDLGTLVRLAKPSLSPDGRQVALIVSRPDLAANQVASTLALIDTKSGVVRTIASGKVSSPTWSPDGKALAWLAPDADKTRQIMMASLVQAGDAPTQITHTAKGAGVRAFAWSPDDQSFAYLAEDTPVPPVGDARFDRTFEVSDSDYLGTTYLARTRGEGPARLWLIDVRGGTSRLLTPNAGYIQDLAWAADGKGLVFNSNPGTSGVSARFGSVRSVTIDGGHETLIVAKDAHVSSESRIGISSQGVLAYQHYRGQDPWLYGNTVAVVIDGQIRDITTALDRDVTGFDWVPQGDAVLLSARDHLRTGLWTVSLSGAVRRLDLGAVNLESAASMAHSGAVAFVGSEPQLVSELYVMASVDSKPVRLTHFNDPLLHRHYGGVKSIAWKSGGFDHDGILLYPPDFRADQRYPLLVDIHGGPHYSSQLSFDGDSQYYAAQGWLVFQPNYRGSDGQGDRYQTAVVGDATEGPGRDIMAGIDAIKAEGSVDAARVALTGWSYGGVMTSWLIGHHHDWCAAVPGALVVDFAGYYDQSDTGIWIDSLLGSPHLPQNRHKYVEQSPATYLDQATTPTLIMQNVGDDNAPVAQAYALYHALKDRGIKTRFVVFGIDGHGPGDPYHERQAVVRTLAWINENCGPGKH